MSKPTYEQLEAAVVKARDLIGDQAGDITGAALDAWIVLSDVTRD